MATDVFTVKGFFNFDLLNCFFLQSIRLFSIFVLKKKE